MAVDTYKFGTKNNWRKWAWNRIVERLDVPAKDAVVLYLGGPENIDAVEAMRRGFRRENMHQIEKSTHVTEGIRNSGGLCINGDFFDVVKAWPHWRRVDVVFGDFCNGLSKRNLDAITTLPLFPQVRSAVFAFNMLRGRDHSTNEIRFDWRRDRCGSEYENSLHRALIAYSEQASACIGVSLGAVEVRDGVARYIESIESTDEFKVMAQKRIPGLQRHCRFSRFEYTSVTKQKFDSGVWISPFRGVDIGWNGKDDGWHDVFKGSEIRRKIAAHLAHQTRRKIGR